MLTRLVFLFALILVSTVFLTGAWPSSIAPLSRHAEIVFAPKVTPLDADIVGTGLDAHQLLDKALSVLAPDRVLWLKTKIRQTVTDAKSSFVAEGFLLRGANHCARLEMNIVAKSGTSRLTVVSDGDVIAVARQLAEKKPGVTVERLADAKRNEVLTRKGCGGPHALVQALKNQLTNATLQTGLLKDKPVIRIKGELKPTQGVQTTFAAHSCCIDLDAKSLWPHRLMWQGVGRDNKTQSVVQIEFLEAELHHELSADECMRVFSYRPN